MYEKSAILFPGQCSQSVGMLTELLAESSPVQPTFREASDALGYALAALVRTGA
ncbi:malonyl CoA-acyl carrier protein transacylase, partial [Pseudoalteromonas ruthenica]